MLSHYHASVDCIQVGKVGEHMSCMKLPFSHPHLARGSKSRNSISTTYSESPTTLRSTYNRNVFAQLLELRMGRLKKATIKTLDERKQSDFIVWLEGSSALNGIQELELSGLEINVF